ncbi:MAG: PIG-L deacetylase family protein [Phycisphaerae bacterium]
MNIVVIGAHPDDPESCCGGLAIKAAGAGHRVVFLFLSSGFVDKKYNDTPVVEVREAQSRTACDLIGAEPHFFRLPDGEIPFNRELVDRVSDFVGEMKADFVLTHWSVDCHPDHQVTSCLATQAAFSNPDIALAYYEAAVGMQTLVFEPNRFVDITEEAKRKKEALFCHVLPGLDSWYHYQDTMERFRGAQMRVDRAEGYILVSDNGRTGTLLETPRVKSAYGDGINPENYMPSTEQKNVHHRSTGANSK